MRTVVLASCQGERFIGAQLDSIIPQLSFNDEIIISDDASTDATLAVVAMRCDKRIRVLRNSQRIGYIGNFQRAISQSCGDTIFFSDQDDVWLPNKVLTLDLALRNKACVSSDAIVVDEQLREIYPSFFQWRRTRSFSAWSILLKPSIVGATLACTRHYLNTLLPLPPGVPHDFWISFNAAWDDSLEIVRAPLILYRRHPTAVSLSATDNRRRATTIAAERIRLIGTALGRRLRDHGTGHDT
jgi:glycosyltransferase involved in cell wall biosynthesis